MYVPLPHLMGIEVASSKWVLATLSLPSCLWYSVEEEVASAACQQKGGQGSRRNGAEWEMVWITTSG